MKITPSKNYKKPLYAIGIAATIAAVSLTGCTDPGRIDYAGDISIATTETDHVRLTGEVADTDPTEVELDGEVDVTESARTTAKPVITAGIVPNTIDPED